MKKYVKYIVISLFFVFSIIYTNKVIEISQYNNTILTSINEYASLKDYRCREGSINNDGIILGISGLVVNKNKSYSNMKGIGFKEELLEFDKDECIDIFLKEMIIIKMFLLLLILIVVNILIKCLMFLKVKILKLIY